MEYKGFNIKIETDGDPADPREWDNLGTMICFHSRYNLGDKTNYNHDDYNSWSELLEDIKKKDNPAIVLPLYLYDHSGLRMKVGSFAGFLPQGHAEFDSGQVGFIIATKKAIKESFMVKKIIKKTLAKAEKILRGEIETYDDYLSGNVFGFIVEDEEGENIDSCHGFYGEAGEKNAIAEAKSIIDNRVEELQRKKEAKTRAYIKNKVPLLVRL